MTWKLLRSQYKDFRRIYVKQNGESCRENNREMSVSIFPITFPWPWPGTRPPESVDRLVFHLRECWPQMYNPGSHSWVLGKVRIRTQIPKGCLNPVSPSYTASLLKVLQNDDAHCMSTSDWAFLKMQTYKANIRNSHWPIRIYKFKGNVLATMNIS